MLQPFFDGLSIIIIITWNHLNCQKQCPKKQHDALAEGRFRIVTRIDPLV